MNESEKNSPCCCPPKAEKSPDTNAFRDCVICGKPLRYEAAARPMTCAICGKEFESNCACEDGHFVCDACHERASIAFFVPFLLQSREKDPLRLLEQVVALPRVHLHGPEHHVIVPCVLLTAYRNNGGELELDSALREAVRRASQVPGGACGYWGVCGAAAGAGIYFSILLGSNPLHRDAWPFPQKLVARCLDDIAALGGPRCCKRTTRLAVRRAAAFTEEFLGIDMPIGKVLCRYAGKNRECIGDDCPYFPRLTKL